MVVVVISAVLSLFLFWASIGQERKLREIHTQAAMIQQNRFVISRLQADLIEYSKKNPAIDPILESTGIKPRSAASAAATAAGTPKPAK